MWWIFLWPQFILSTACVFTRVRILFLIILTCLFSLKHWLALVEWKEGALLKLSLRWSFCLRRAEPFINKLTGMTRTRYDSDQAWMISPVWGMIEPIECSIFLVWRLHCYTWSLPDTAAWSTICESVSWLHLIVRIVGIFVAQFSWQMTAHKLSICSHALSSSRSHIQLTFGYFTVSCWTVITESGRNSIHSQKMIWQSQLVWPVTGKEGQLFISFLAQLAKWPGPWAHRRWWGKGRSRSLLLRWPQHPPHAEELGHLATLSFPTTAYFYYGLRRQIHVVAMMLLQFVKRRNCNLPWIWYMCNNQHGRCFWVPANLRLRYVHNCTAIVIIPFHGWNTCRFLRGWSGLDLCELYFILCCKSLIVYNMVHEIVWLQPLRTTRSVL